MFGSVTEPFPRAFAGVACAAAAAWAEGVLRLSPRMNKDVAMTNAKSLRMGGGPLAEGAGGDVWERSQTWRAVTMEAMNRFNVKMERIHAWCGPPPRRPAP